MDAHVIEKKWQERWENAKLFEANVDATKKKFFVTFPYPYVNGAPHIGHSYSSMRTDAYARFKRMQGYNVLYPQGFHATGEPILGVIERLKKNDASQIATLKSFGATDADIEKFKMSPEYLVNFWIDKWKRALKAAGFAIDWRRSFVTTTLTPQYSRFIEWQYNTLKKLGYVVQGTHPVIWCPHDQSPTGDHDRLEGEGESPVEFTILKFAFGDKFICAATLRPETVFGQTNMWVNPEVEYEIILVNGKEKWIVSMECTEKLKDQLKTVKHIGTVKGAELVGKYCRAPVIDREIIILPSSFTDPKMGTGLVTSVPSHAPFDWQALEDLKKNPSALKKYDIDQNAVNALVPISLIKLEGFGEHPAQDIVKKMGITSQKDHDKLKEALKIIYKKEHHTGIMKPVCGKYAGMPVETAKEEIKNRLLKEGSADFVWEITGDVVCRCTTPCHVKILENQWFLKFSDDAWKEKVRKMLACMEIYPKEARNNFENTIEWLKDKACTRKGGLGTPLPWDKTWIVETLSDSTIYMAYYTIARIINERHIPAEKLTDEVFDYIFLNKGQPKFDDEALDEMRREFEYFYPLDFRNSGKDLIQNHLTFFLFHHAAIWPEQKWPCAISVNGFVNVESEKMSKSKGNIIPLMKLIGQYGSDIVRFNIVTAAEGIDDADLRSEGVKGVRARFEFLYETMRDVAKAGGKKTGADLYIINAVRKSAAAATGAYEQMAMRTAGMHALFDATNAFKWYLRRTGGLKNANADVLRSALETATKALAPLAPHLCEELWEMLGKKTFVSAELLTNEKYDDSHAEGEQLIQKVVEDIEQIKKLAGKGKKKAIVYVAEPWKFEAYERLAAGEEQKKALTAMISANKALEKDISSFILSVKGNPPAAAGRNTQLAILKDASAFITRETGMDVRVEEAMGQSQKARSSKPEKPGILLE